MIPSQLGIVYERPGSGCDRIKFWTAGRGLCCKTRLHTVGHLRGGQVLRYPLVTCHTLVHHDHLSPPHGPLAPPLPRGGMELPTRGSCNSGPRFSWLARPVFPARRRTLPRHPPFLSQDAFLRVNSRCFTEHALIHPPDHGPQATKYLKAFIGDHYVHSDKPVFQALWENYNNCQFVEDEGIADRHNSHNVSQRSHIR